MTDTTVVSNTGVVTITEKDVANAVISTTVIDPSAGTTIVTTNTLSGPNSVSSMTPDLDKRLIELTGCIAAGMNALDVAISGKASTASVSALQTQVSANLYTLNGIINDTMMTGATNTWSIDKITSYVTSAITSALSGISPNLLTVINQIKAELTADTGSITTILTSIAGSIRFDIAQSLTGPQEAQARSNIGAVSADDVTAAIESHKWFSDIDLCAVFAYERTH